MVAQYDVSCLPCILCCSSTDPPLPEDELSVRHRYLIKYHYQPHEKFQVATDKAPWVQPGCCVATCCCAPLAIARTRSLTLEHVGARYTCCQGLCCPENARVCDAFCCSDTRPDFALFWEALCCPGWAAAATRIVLMDHYDLGADPVDSQLMWCTSWLACLGLCCGDLAYQACADVVFTCVVCCITAQTYHEVALRKNHKQFGIPLSFADHRDPDPISEPLMMESTPMLYHETEIERENARV